MLDFYGLKKLISKEKLWTTEKEHSDVIKTVEQASSLNLPRHLINEVFPYGSKSYEFNHKKLVFCEKIRNNNPFPTLPSQFLKVLPEEEMRTFIEKLYTVLQNQFDECIEQLYALNRNDEDFERIKEIFSKKILKTIKIESAIAIFIIVWCIISVAILFITRDINYFRLIILSIAIIFIFLLFYGISKNKFKIDKDKYPKL